MQPFSILLALCCLLLLPLSAQAQSNPTPQCPVTIEGVYAAKAHTDSSQPVNVRWEKVALPNNWSRQWPEHTGTVWYRLDWRLGCALQQDTPPIAIAINSINMAGMVYVNNSLIWQDDHLQEPLSRSWNTPRYWVIPSATLQQGHNQLLIKVVGSALYSSGLGRVNIGDTTTTLKNYETAWWSQRTVFLINVILSITLGTLCLSIWLLRRQEKAFGWFALASFFWVGFITNVLATETAPFPNGYVLAKANLSFFIAYIHCFCLFTWRFAHQRYPRLEKGFWLLSALCLLVLWLSPLNALKSTILNLFLIYVGVMMACSVFFQYLAFKARQREQWLLAMTLLACMLLALDSVLDLFGINKSLQTVLPYTSTIVALFLTLILAMRLTRSLKHIERFNQELSEKVVAAQQELSISLANKHAITLKNTQLQERLNLSHELHDGLGSSLVRAMATVDQSKKGISNEQFMSMLKLLRNDLRQIVDSGANVNTKLPENPSAWLAPLRHRFLQIFDELDIALSWSVPQTWTAQPSTLQCLTLYRVLEEALTNIVKHSEASQVTVAFSIEASVLTLKVGDNGVGFNVEAVKQSGFSVGMRSMQARIERLGGHINVTSSTSGTLIQAQTPLRDNTALNR